MRRKNYNTWKSLSLVLIGFTTGIFVEKQFFTPPSAVTTVQVHHDSIVTKKDTLYVMRITIPKLNKENLYKELLLQKIPHPNIVLKQALLETGHFTSNVCKSKNNLFGLRKGNSYRNYNNWVSCVQDYKRLISKRYRGGDYYAFLERINYAEDPDYILKLKRKAI